MHTIKMRAGSVMDEGCEWGRLPSIPMLRCMRPQLARRTRHGRRPRRLLTKGGGGRLLVCALWAAWTPLGIVRVHHARQAAD